MRIPPALAARATPQVLELLGEPPGRVLELGFAGIHATPLRLAGFSVSVFEPDPVRRSAARERAGAVLDTAPAESFDVVVAPEDADLTGIAARRAILVGHDGSAWSSALS